MKFKDIKLYCSQLLYDHKYILIGETVNFCLCSGRVSVRKYNINGIDRLCPSFKRSNLMNRRHRGCTVESKISIPDTRWEGKYSTEQHKNAFKGSQFHFYLLLLQRVLYCVAALKVSPYIFHSVDHIFLMVLCDQRGYSEKSEKLVSVYIRFLTNV